MNIIGIDPGPEHSGIVIFDGKSVPFHAVISNDDVLTTLEAHCRARLKKLIAIEMIASYGMPAGRELFETCLWIGRMIQVAAINGTGWRTVYRMDVKQNLCHDSRAKDPNIRQALIDRFGKPGTKKAPGATYGLVGDEWAAMAVAVTVWDRIHEELPLGTDAAGPGLAAGPGA